MNAITFNACNAFTEFTVAHAQGYSFGYEHHGYASKIAQLVEERCAIIFVNRLFFSPCG